MVPMPERFAAWTLALMGSCRQRDASGAKHFQRPGVPQQVTGDSVSRVAWDQKVEGSKSFLPSQHLLGPK